MNEISYGKKVVFLISLAALLLCWSTLTRSAEFSFTKIADTATRIPGTEDNFTHFGPPSNDSGTVAFYGMNQTTVFSHGGVYTSKNGVISVVADLNTPFPGGSGTFNMFEGMTTSEIYPHPSLDNGDVAFIGSGPLGGHPQTRGVFKFTNGQLRVVANEQTPPPNGPGPFYVRGPNVSIDEGNVAFKGYPGVYEGLGFGVYVERNGAIQLIADTNTTEPGGTNTIDTFSGDPWLEGNTVAFATANGPEQGVYTRTGAGPFTVVANRNTQPPGQTGRIFAYFDNVILDGGDVIFAGTSTPPGQEAQQTGGIYKYSNGTLSSIVEAGDPVPGGGGTTWLGIGGVSAEGGHIAFTGGYGQLPDSYGYQVIATDIDGSFREVIHTGDQLDGKKITKLYINTEALYGNTIAFRATFEDQSQGIYVADILGLAPPTIALP